MPLFLIERNFAEAVEADPEFDATIKAVNDEIGIQWLFSFLSADKRKTYCLYEAPGRPKDVSYLVPVVPLPMALGLSPETLHWADQATRPSD